MKKNVLIVGAGGVAHVAAHKCAQNNDVLGDICIASRTQSKCDAIIESIKRKNNIKDKSKKLSTRQLNASDIAACEMRYEFFLWTGFGLSIRPMNHLKYRKISVFIAL